MIATVAIRARFLRSVSNIWLRYGERVVECSVGDTAASSNFAIAKGRTPHRLLRFWACSDLYTGSYARKPTTLGTLVLLSPGLRAHPALSKQLHVRSWFSPLFSLEDGLPFLEEGFAGFLGVLATEGDANIGQLVAELLLHVAGLERFHHAAF